MDSNIVSLTLFVERRRVCADWPARTPVGQSTDVGVWRGETSSLTDKPARPVEPKRDWSAPIDRPVSVFRPSISRRSRHHHRFSSRRLCPPTAEETRVTFWPPRKIIRKSRWKTVRWWPFIPSKWPLVTIVMKFSEKLEIISKFSWRLWRGRSPINWKRMNNSCVFRWDFDEIEMVSCAWSQLLDFWIRLISTLTMSSGTLGNTIFFDLFGRWSRKQMEKIAYHRTVQGSNQTLEIAVIENMRYHVT